LRGGVSGTAGAEGGGLGGRVLRGLWRARGAGCLGRGWRGAGAGCEAGV
jgi:hypothetical protein